MIPFGSKDEVHLYQVHRALHSQVLPAYNQTEAGR